MLMVVRRAYDYGQPYVNNGKCTTSTQTPDAWVLPETAVPEVDGGSANGIVRETPLKMTASLRRNKSLILNKNKNSEDSKLGLPFYGCQNSH